MPVTRAIRAIHYLAAHEITPIEVLYVPFLALTTLAAWQTPAAMRHASPIYQHLSQLAPLWAWFAVIAGCALAIALGILLDRLWVAIVGYLVSATIWLIVARALHNLTDTWTTPLVYLFIACAGMLRGGVLWVVHHERSAARE